MKQYLIRIENGHASEFTTIYGDSFRPFMIARNLWNYNTPWHAAQRLEKIAQAWENNGHAVKRIFGTVADMPTRGDAFNVELTLIDFNASSKTYRELIKERYHY